MGSNLTERSLQRAVRCASPLYTICKQQFDRETGVPVVTSAHKTKSEEGDVSQVVAQVLHQDLLTQTSGRKHNAFPTMQLNPLDKWDRKATETWIERKKKEYGKHRGRFRENNLDRDEEFSSDDSD